eukprot:2304978-Pleurochrysis_carterae.AAC.1
MRLGAHLSTGPRVRASVPRFPPLFPPLSLASPFGRSPPQFFPLSLTHTLRTCVARALSQVFTLGLIWDSATPSREQITSTLAHLDTEIDLSKARL